MIVYKFKKNEYLYSPLWRGVGVGLYKKPFIFLNFSDFMDKLYLVNGQLKILWTRAHPVMFWSIEIDSILKH